MHPKAVQKQKDKKQVIGGAFYPFVFDVYDLVAWAA